MDKLTRKELKTDHFVEEIGHGVDFVADHRKQMTLYGVIAAAVLLIGGGGYYYMQTQKAARQELLSKAYLIQAAQAGPAQPGMTPPYATEADKERAAGKAFADVVAKYGSSDEGLVAKYFLGVQAANAAKWTEAEKYLKEVGDGGQADVSSTAKLALAQVYAAQNKVADAEAIYRGLMDKPTAFVSKEQAAIALGRLLSPTKPAEAKKLLEPLRADKASAVSRAAINALGDVK
ncbi:MAG: tetratricopeptide repeat protein [Acidobacteria bacterium]|nr:tetratricopeptide repeat protein [Acidobacteriota bacterium]